MDRAFTLLELLVVITIIGVLASIVVVSMSGSTDSATIAKGKAFSQQVRALLGHEAVLDLNFNESTADTCPDGEDVCDASGYGNNGTLYGNASFIPSSVDGYALSFDGAGDYVNCGNNSILDVFRTSGSKLLTIEVWIKRNIIGTAQQIINKGIAGEGYKLEFTPANGILFTTWGVKDYYFSSTVTDTKWHHIAIVFDSSYDATFYLDGLSNEKIAGNLVGISSNQSLEIGIRSSTTHSFSGLIDEVRIYAEALSATKIQKHYVQGLEKLLANQAIIQSEYDQRMEEFTQFLARYEE
jgi:prepilin-type N-terminal cleavage/methylation domain-containing protein